MFVNFYISLKFSTSYFNIYEKSGKVFKFFEDLVIIGIKDFKKNQKLKLIL